tara:strand:+ start:406 stop:552 length:147 start_codon:yes stop_codon:yes gene_type:complete
MAYTVKQLVEKGFTKTAAEKVIKARKVCHPVSDYNKTTGLLKKSTKKK